ncbi:hypothetical protein N8I77_007485 [Diaporthe amygdali]|uniref:non-specific serine/threonine protein kinase n=1 Tax=Phomopsis amygdali TaxID=1214568 RepID=A0AAD9W1E9_PHOAM|nr:hypothetical protein N8I77_007485 [Diaporthe amygdali]
MSLLRNSKRLYNQIGVFLPFESEGDDDRVMEDSRVARDDRFMDNGFLFVKSIKMGMNGKFNAFGNRVSDKSIFIVQSVSTGELFINKLMERPWNDSTKTSSPPLELRVSTYPHTTGDADIDLPDNGGDDVHRKGLLPDLLYFNKLRFWQELDDPMEADYSIYSLYFEYCNGGTLENIIDAYQAKLIAIPEHFIWLVAEQLFLALATLNFGRQHDPDDDDQSYEPGDWARIYHRDLTANNTFINYPPRRSGRIPKAGMESNAFPEIVVGDFGMSAIEGDDPSTLPPSIYPAPDDDEEDDETVLAPWEDICSAGEILRTMSMTHFPPTMGFELNVRPNCRLVQDVNQAPSAPPYSDELITMLQRFEWPNQDQATVRELGDALDTTFPSPRFLTDILLPQAQRRVAQYRNPTPKPAGYYDDMDMSWTKPRQVMPFSYSMQYATEAGDGPDGMPPPDDNDDDDDDDGHDDQDREMSDPPPDDDADHDEDGQQGDEQQDEGGQSGDQSHSSGDDDDSDMPFPGPPPPRPDAEQLAMRELGKLHKWNNARLRYELRSLEFNVPTIVPLKNGPP